MPFVFKKRALKNAPMPLLPRIGPDCICSTANRMILYTYLWQSMLSKSWPYNSFIFLESSTWFSINQGKAMLINEPVDLYGLQLFFFFVGWGVNKLNFSTKFGKMWASYNYLQKSICITKFKGYKNCIKNCHWKIQGSYSNSYIFPRVF